MIGLATSSALPELTGGESLLLQELRERGPCKPVIWNDPAETWRDCSLIIVRTPWDYMFHVREFLQWIDQVEAAGITLYNSPNVMRWNSDKLYLRDLASRGVKVIETTWIPRGKLTKELLAKSMQGPSVLKPTVSGGAYDTHRVSVDNIDEIVELMSEVNKEKSLMLQPFAPEILSPGEYSLIFFDKEFSHAVLKTPQAGDFRVQSKHGGTYAAVKVDAAIISQAKKVLGAVPYDDRLLYARVDGVIRDGEFLLMELEVIEPYLFLEFGDNASAKLATLL